MVPVTLKWASQVALVIKNPPANAGDLRDVSSIPGSGRSPGEGNGNPLQDSCLENPMDRGAWQATVHRVAKSRVQLKWVSTHTQRLKGHSQPHSGSKWLNQDLSTTETANGLDILCGSCSKWVKYPFYPWPNSPSLSGILYSLNGVGNSQKKAYNIIGRKGPSA